MMPGNTRDLESDHQNVKPEHAERRAIRDVQVVGLRRQRVSQKSDRRKHDR
jgi:hypothetical protein